MTEDQLEQEALGWLGEVGYETLYGLDIAPDGETPERANYRQVLLEERLRIAVDRLNPTIPVAARADAIQQVIDLGIPSPLSANCRFHQLLVTGVPVSYNVAGETRGDFVRLIDWSDPARNAWLAVNQFSIRGPHHTRRPDIICSSMACHWYCWNSRIPPTKMPTSGKPTTRSRPTRNRFPSSSITTNC